MKPTGRPSRSLRRVALPAEGVDRNTPSPYRRFQIKESPSPRRAWIEISERLGVSRSHYVALPAEGVDRNESPAVYCENCNASPSPRRAWIEILRGRRPVLRLLGSPSPRRAWIEISWKCQGLPRAPRSPSPRRAWIEMVSSSVTMLLKSCRPPRGGRG